MSSYSVNEHDTHRLHFVRPIRIRLFAFLLFLGAKIISTDAQGRRVGDSLCFILLEMAVRVRLNSFLGILVCGSVALSLRKVLLATLAGRNACRFLCTSEEISCYGLASFFISAGETRGRNFYSPFFHQPFFELSQLEGIYKRF